MDCVERRRILWISGGFCIPDGFWSLSRWGLWGLDAIWSAEGSNARTCFSSGVTSFVTVLPPAHHARSVTCLRSTTAHLSLSCLASCSPQPLCHSLVLPPHNPSVTLSSCRLPPTAAATLSLPSTTTHLSLSCPLSTASHLSLSSRNFWTRRCSDPQSTAHLPCPFLTLDISASC